MNIEPLAAPLGAVITDLEPTDNDPTDNDPTDNDPTGDTTARRLRDALARHRLLVLPAFVDTGTARSVEAAGAALETIAAMFGEASAVVETSNLALDGTPRQPPDPGHGATGWVMDGSYLDQPPVATLTVALEVTRRGGQTQYADMAQVWRLLPPEARNEISTLSLVHRDPTGARPPVEHQWLRQADDGTESLYMGAHATEIVGRGIDEGRRWFDEIEAQLPVHDIFHEHRWQPGDLVIHDPRTVMHRTLGYDIAAEPRRMLTVAVQDPPRG